jgi:large subunit ribosomal protein L2
VLQLPSGLEKKVSTNFFGILGRLSNVFHKKERVGSAGLSHHLGVRPSVRGIAMNPVDHPHGGRTNTNKPEVSP